MTLANGTSTLTEGAAAADDKVAGCGFLVVDSDVEEPVKLVGVGPEVDGSDTAWFAQCSCRAISMRAMRSL